MLIGFGINDRNSSDTSRYAEASTTFKTYLTRYVQETRAAGAHPIIVSTVRRNAWTNDTTVYNAYHGHPIASRQLAAALNVPLIDLDSTSKVLMEPLGEPYCEYYWYMNLDAGEYPTSGAYSGGVRDDVHFQEMGAIEMARLVTEEIQSLAADSNVSRLIPHLKPLYEVNVTASVDTSWDEYRGLITRTASYPEGLNVTLKVKPEAGAEFIKWSSGTVDSLTDDVLIQFTMGTEDTSYTAHFFYPPRIEIQNPVDGDKFELGRDIPLDVFAHQVSDTNATVVIFDGQNEIARLSTDPYMDTLRGVGPGPHSIIAKAITVFGDTMESPAVSFTVDSGYPHITMIEPAGNAFYQLGDTIKVRATAYDSDGTLDTVKFYLDGVAIAELTTEPYSHDIINPAAGVYTLYAAAIDNDGNVTTTDMLTLEVGPTATIQELETGYCGIRDSAGAIEFNHQGYTGTGFVNVDNVAGTTIDYTVNFRDTGEYKFVFRYAATSTRPGDLMINGKIVGSVPFLTRTAWDDWGFSSVNYSVTDTEPCRFPLSQPAARACPTSTMSRLFH